jgi:hypothetical protein
MVRARPPQSRPAPVSGPSIAGQCSSKTEGRGLLDRVGQALAPQASRSAPALIRRRPRRPRRWRPSSAGSSAARTCRPPSPTGWQSTRACGRRSERGSCASTHHAAAAAAAAAATAAQHGADCRAQRPLARHALRQAQLQGGPGGRGGGPLAAAGRRPGGAAAAAPVAQALGAAGVRAGHGAAAARHAGGRALGQASPPAAPSPFFHGKLPDPLPGG